MPGCHLRNIPWPGIIYLFPARKSLVNDIPAGDGKIAIPFLQCKTPFYMFRALGWEEARQQCLLQSSDLAEMNTLEEQEIFVKYLNAWSE
jgi:hypothetical protein